MCIEMCLVSLVSSLWGGILFMCIYCKRESKLSSHSAQELSHIQEHLSSDDESSDLYRDSRLSLSNSDTDMPGSEIYRLAINSVGSSAQNRLDTRDGSSNDEVKQMSALVDADDDVGDDWLVNDIQWPQSKKRSTAVSDVLTTSTSRDVTRKRSRTESTRSYRNSAFSLPVRKKRNKFSRNERIDRDESDTDEAGSKGQHDNECIVSSSSGTDNISKSMTLTNDYVWDDDDDDLLCQIDTVYDGNCTMETNIDMLSQNERKSNNAAQVTSFTPGRNIPESRISDNLVRTIHRKPSVQFDTNFRTDCTTVLPMLDVNVNRKILDENKESTERFEKPTYANSIRVKVKIGEQTLLLPIQPSDQVKTISWLFQQVKERYFNMFLLLPTLTLSTQDGTFLYTADTIKTVLQDGDLLIANVTAWERPKLEDRYVQACKLCLTGTNTHIISLLQKTDQSGQLHLSDMGLGYSTLQPVFQALDDHKILTELKINGNRLGDAGIASLMKLLTGLPHVKILSLETNGISSDGLQTMSSALKSDPCLQELTTLSLSHNCLDDIAAEPLASVIGRLPKLSQLSLSSCNFSHRLFTISLREALKERRLEHMNMSENNLGDEGLRFLLFSLHSDCLKNLDISHTRSTADQDVFQYLQDFVSDGKSCLLELSLAGNQLSHADVTFINRLPVLARSLHTLILSQNQNINNKSLQKLLYLSADKSSNLEEITARGCSVSSPLDQELLDAMRNKIVCPVPLKKFVFTCRGLTESDSQNLRDIWLNKWKNQGHVKIERMSVSLTVKMEDD